MWVTSEYVSHIQVTLWVMGQQVWPIVNFDWMELATYMVHNYIYY